MVEEKLPDSSPDLDREGLDVFSLVQSVLREAYLENTETLEDYAKKVRFYNERKKSIRCYLAALRELRERVLASAFEKGINLCDESADNKVAIAGLLDASAKSYPIGPIEHELCFPNRVPKPGVKGLDMLDEEINNWEERLQIIGDDSQMASVDLQNYLQKLQQTLQMMSNISKLVHDSIMTILRNMKS